MSKPNTQRTSEKNSLRLQAGAQAVPAALPTQDCARLLQAAQELYAVEDLAAFPLQVLKSLASVIPHSSGGCHVLEPSRQGVVTTCYDPARPAGPAADKDFWRLAQSHPLTSVLSANPARAWKLSDVISRRAFQATEIYQALYRPLGVDCELTAQVPDTSNPEIVLRISLHRDGHDFTEAERVMLNLLLPHVGLARRRLQASRVAARNNAERPPLDAPEFQIWVRQRTQWGLTPREGEVLFWLCQGKTNAEIGRILGIAERTAETHALRIYPKMGVENRYTAIATLSRLWAGQGG